jgi:hypothetical protein
VFGHRTRAFYASAEATHNLACFDKLWLGEAEYSAAGGGA